MGAVLVLARAPVAGACKTRLEPLLGADGCARLQGALIARAARWACAAAAPGAAFLGHTGAPALVRGLVPAGMRLFPQVEGGLGERIAAAVDHAFERAGGPLLVVGADAVALGPAHASAAFDDLAGGRCDVTLGPATDGGYYLVGLRERRPELFALAGAAWGGPRVLRLTIAAAEEAGLRIGLLRAERDLDEPPDARALLADPLTAADIRAVLR